jgi:hypothetical protein
MRAFIIATATTAAAALFSLPALTQQRQGTVSIPDFSGIWAHFTWPDAEPPLSGPGPVTNTSRRDGYGLVGDYTSPILKPQAADGQLGMNSWNKLGPSAIYHAECNNNLDTRQCSSREGPP